MNAIIVKNKPATLFLLISESALCCAHRKTYSDVKTIAHKLRYNVIGGSSNIAEFIKKDWCRKTSNKPEDWSVI